MNTSRAVRSVIGVVLLCAVVGCTDGPSHRAGDVYERNNMPSASPGRLAGPHALNNDAGGDVQAATPTR